MECKDSRCAIHGKIKVRGNVFVGTVKSAKPSKTVVVEREITHFIPKYERYKKGKSTLYAHNPECINAREGEIVRIGETRKLSKTKSFVVLKVLTKQEAEKKEVKEEKKEEKEGEKERKKEKKAEEKKGKKNKVEKKHYKKKVKKK